MSDNIDAKYYDELIRDKNYEKLWRIERNERIRLQNEFTDYKKMVFETNKNIQKFFVNFIRSLNGCLPDVESQSEENFADKHTQPKTGLVEFSHNYFHYY